MELRGAGAVVTGAGNGIGRAVVLRLVRAGARVVAADRDAEALSRLAEEADVHAVPGDVAGVEGVTHLVEEARAHLGEVDLYVANAGVDEGGGVTAPEEAWERSLEVNVMAHVRAARLLLPRWLERGEGRLVVTASAAGLLTMLGSAPYSVSKHAAVAFAEWLSVTYGDRGVVVQALCPQGVRTRMLEEAGPAAALLEAEAPLEPEDVAEVLHDALQGDRFLVLPHPAVERYVAARATDHERWLAGMRRLQATLPAGVPDDFLSG